MTTIDAGSVTFMTQRLSVNPRNKSIHLKKNKMCLRNMMPPAPPINPCKASCILGYPSNLPDGRVVFLDDHQNSSSLALAYHNVLFLCIFFHFHVYMIENIPFEKGKTCHFFLHRCSKHFLLLISCQSPSSVVEMEHKYLTFRS